MNIRWPWRRRHIEQAERAKKVTEADWGEVERVTKSLNHRARVNHFASDLAAAYRIGGPRHG